MTASRLPTGGTHIDRSTSIAFEFDGRTLTGFAGDTIASALLANGVDVVGRSIYHDRPRGIVSAGPEEPNALVQVRWPDGASEPMLPATTVMLQEGMAVSSLAGRGRLEPVGDGGDPGRFDSRHAHCEVLVIGAGESGRRAAAVAQVSNPEDRVLLIDADPVGDGRRRPIRDDRARHLRPRLRDGRGAPADADDRGAAVAHPGPAHRHRDRRHGTADRLRRRRPSRDHARRRSGDLRGAVRRPSRRPGGHLHEQRHHRCRGRRHRGSRRRARGDRRRARGRPRRRHERRRRRAPDLGDDRARRRRSRDRGGRPAARVRRLEPERGAVEPRPGHAPVRRADRGVRPGQARSPRADRGRRCRRRRDRGPRRDRPDLGRATTRARDRRCVGDPLRRCRVATRPCATCSGRSAPASSRSSTSSATRRSAPASSRGAVGGVVASAIAASILGQEVGAVGVPTFRPPTVPVSFAQLAGPRPWRHARRPRPDDPDPGVARRERRGLRGRRPVEAAALLPARRRVDGRGRPARVRRRPDRRGRDGRDDARQDRHPGSGRRDLPGPGLHEHVLDAQGGVVPVRAHVPPGRDGLRRRRDVAAVRGPVPHDDDDRQRGARPRPPGGMAPDRMARAARPRHERHRAMDDGRGRGAARPRGRGRARPGPRCLERGVPVHDLARGGHRGHARSRVPHLVLRASWRSSSTSRPGTAWPCGKR